MKKLLPILLLAFVVLGVGCTTADAVPKSGFRVNPKTGWVEIISPKDSELKNAIFTRMETNGVVFTQLQIGDYRTAMNPEVVKESASGTAAMIQASAQMGAQMFMNGLAAAKAASGVPSIPAPTPPK